jgi:hypothetical protein
MLGSTNTVSGQGGGCYRRLHDAVFQKVVIFILAAVRT